MNVDGLSEHHRREAEKEIDFLAENIEKIKQHINSTLKQLPWFPDVITPIKEEKTTEIGGA